MTGTEHEHHEPGWRTSAHVTGHCLLGCSIGEVTGLVVGTALGFPPIAVVALAVALAFLFGMGLAILPLLSKGLSFGAALSTVWLGEVVSISVMEIAMNATDWAIGGVQAGSLLSPLFWIGMAAAIPAGFLAAWPVNHWLVTRNLKACH